MNVVWHDFQFQNLPSSFYRDIVQYQFEKLGAFSD